ncbi:unnamed protein product [Lactuca virosa]|uniref:Uncharacterized protein n=1 Tax=Lactuca virosa TaxID=75947 RepID=A0AAU9LNM1_9ASTR|nr:unnamed protein product [Lactuca virosa]
MSDYRDSEEEEVDFVIRYLNRDEGSHLTSCRFTTVATIRSTVWLKLKKTFHMNIRSLNFKVVGNPFQLDYHYNGSLILRSVLIRFQLPCKFFKMSYI